MFVLPKWIDVLRLRGSRGLARVSLLAGLLCGVMLAGCSRSAGEEDARAASTASDDTGYDPDGPRPKNFILISLDTVRADHVGAYGYERDTTPRLDAFADRGALFLNCTSPSAWTVPAHMSIFTGVEPPAHGCTYYQDVGRVNPRFETLQKIFNRHGFHTGAFTGGGFMSQRYGMFDEFDTFSSKGTHFADNLPDVWDWIDAVGDEPMFLFLHGFDAHKAYLPPPPYNTRFSGDYRGHYPVARFCKPGVGRPDPVDVAYVMSQYDGEIAAVDDVIADFLDELERRGILQESLVVILTDHGDEFYEHGRCDHIHSLYDELIRAAWIMVGPSIPAVKVRDHVGTIDILPTVLDVFGFDSPAQFQGVSRLAALDGHREARDDYIYSFTGRGSPPYHLSSVRTNRWKLITDLPAGHPNKNCPLCAEGSHSGVDMWLFDLQKDPGEEHNLAGQYQEFALELLSRIQNRIAASLKLGLDTVEPSAESPEDTERLRALGYIE